jgi:hypothetical protein
MALPPATLRKRRRRRREYRERLDFFESPFISVFSLTGG